jgi:hypothetical protein
MMMNFECWILDDFLLPKDHCKFPTSNENPNENLEEKQVIQKKHTTVYAKQTRPRFPKIFFNIITKHHPQGPATPAQKSRHTPTNAPSDPATHPQQSATSFLICKQAFIFPLHQSIKLLQ